MQMGNAKSPSGRTFRRIGPHEKLAGGISISHYRKKNLPLMTNSWQHPAASSGNFSSFICELGIISFSRQMASDEEGTFGHQYSIQIDLVRRQFNSLKRRLLKLAWPCSELFRVAISLIYPVPGDGSRCIIHFA